MSKTETKTLTCADRRAIMAREIRTVLDGMTPAMGTRFTGAQLSYAKGRGKRNALAAIDSMEA